MSDTLTYACIECAHIRVNRKHAWVECEILLMALTDRRRRQLNKISLDIRRYDLDVGRCWGSQIW